MTTAESNWFVADAEADRTQVVVELRDDSQNLVRYLRAHELGHRLR